MSERTERVDALVDEAKALAGHIAAAQGRLAVLASQIVELMGHVGPGWGFRTPAHRLGFELGLVPAEARRLVTVAERVDELPELADAARTGKLSLTVAAAIAEVARPETVDDLLELNESATASQMQRICATHRNQSDPNPDPPPDFFRLRPSGQRWKIDGSLAATDGTLLQQALEAKRNQLFEQLGRPATTVEALMAMALGDAPDMGADRYLALIHIDADRHLADESGSARVVGGPELTDTEIDRLLEDCSTIAVISRQGRPAWISDRARTPPPWMRRLLRARHSTCAFPGCDTTGYLEAHHTTPYARQPTTAVDELVLLCWFHHHQLHETGGTVEALETGRFRFLDPHGNPIDPTRARPTTPAGPIEVLSPHPPRGPTTPSGDPLTHYALDTIHEHLLTRANSP